MDDPTASAGRLQLTDGRYLAYRWFGADPAGDGPVVVHNHGGLSSSLDAASAHEVAAAAGIRVLAPDRPGVGGSDRHPGHDVADWADDVAALLDHFGIGTGATTGWSMGGQYALALAARLPERVARAAVIAGCPPLD
ncbi:MAG: alpha/beta fold hydrolase, partial [Acidimicrobiales bacterium]